MRLQPEIERQTSNKSSISKSKSSHSQQDIVEKMKTIKVPKEQHLVQFDCKVEMINISDVGAAGADIQTIASTSALQLPGHYVVRIEPAKTLEERQAELDQIGGGNQ